MTAAARETAWRAVTRISSRPLASKCRKSRSPTWRPGVPRATRPLVIDVREQSEWDQGHDPRLVHIPRSFLESRIAGVARPDRRSSSAAPPATARCWPAPRCSEMGYAQRGRASPAASSAGSRAASEYDVPQTLTPDQRSRYSRHVLIPEIGEAGQLKLLDSKALLIGAGGLGSPAAFYLAAAGVGTHRPGRRRRRGRQQPPAPDHPHHRPRRHEQGRVGPGRHRGAQPGRDGQRPPLPGRQGQRPRPDLGLRRDHRRHRQLPDALPDERRAPS